MANDVTPPVDVLTSIAASYSWRDTVLEVQAPNTSQAFPENPKRVTLIISNNGGTAAILFFRPAVNTQGAITLHPDKQPLILSITQLGPLVQQPVNLFCQTVTTISVFEIYRVN